MKQVCKLTHIMHIINEVKHCQTSKVDICLPHKGEFCRRDICLAVGSLTLEYHHVHTLKKITAKNANSFPVDSPSYEINQMYPLVDIEISM